ncbi:glutaminase A [Urechidicola sp. KH5]
MKISKSFVIFLLILLISDQFICYSQSEISVDDNSIKEALDSAYVKFKDLNKGENANYIPALAEVPSELYGIVIVTADGRIFKIGDVNYNFSIQSISKVFTMAQVVEKDGPQIIQDSVGVNPTGQVFNSIYPIEQHKGKGINPFVNPGAIATTSLVKGASYDEKFDKILKIHSDFAGRDLKIDQVIYESEAATNGRNQAISMLLNAYGRIYSDPLESTDIYTKQCAISVNTVDLATMAGTLANGGINPLTKSYVVSSQTVSYVLPIMTVAGLYDNAGFWLYHVGIPAKSGVGGGVIAVVPGKFGIAAFSPPLDEAGNSVRAQWAIYDVVLRLGVNPYLIQPIK